MSVQKPPTLPPQRGHTHRVDTLAFRKLLNHLHVDWVVRSMEERDYGIDLQLEIFDGSYPTGSIVFAQLKGTDKSFAEEPSFQFPVKTLLYAELFNAPFFLFRTSIRDDRTRFIWLQKFIETKISDSSPNWRKQEHVLVSLPDGNDLASDPARFLKLAREPVRQQQALQFLRIEYDLALHAPSVLSGEYTDGFRCSSEAKKLEQLKEFIVGGEWEGEADYRILCELYSYFDDIALKGGVDAQQEKYVKMCLGIMDTIKITYLSEPEIHHFVTTKRGVNYY